MIAIARLEHTKKRCNETELKNVAITGKKQSF